MFRIVFAVTLFAGLLWLGLSMHAPPETSAEKAAGPAVPRPAVPRIPEPIRFPEDPDVEEPGREVDLPVDGDEVMAGTAEEMESVTTAPLVAGGDSSAEQDAPFEPEPLGAGPWEDPGLPDPLPDPRLETPPNPDAYRAAIDAIERQGGRLEDVAVIGVVDLTLPSNERRLVVYDRSRRKITRHLVAHGRNSGALYATAFSNQSGSSMSSRGLFEIGSSYNGKHGLSMRLHGLEKGVNDRAFDRAIVMHKAWYVSYLTVLENIGSGLEPRIGRSRGCPAVSVQEADFIFNKLRPGTFLYIHAPEPATGAEVTQNL